MGDRSDDPGAANLRNWARFEADNPDTFAGMYLFRIQRPAGHCATENHAE